MIDVKQVNFDAILIEDCLDLYEKKGICTVLNDGKIVDFCVSTCEDYV